MTGPEQQPRFDSTFIDAAMRFKIDTDTELRRQADAEALRLAAGLTVRAAFPRAQAQETLGVDELLSKPIDRLNPRY